MEILTQTLGFWTGFLAGLFILLHIPSCNKHWAHSLKPFSTFLKKYHHETLVIATIFALAHIIIDIIGLIFGIWI